MRYSKIAIFLHWLIAIAIVTLLVMGWLMTNLGPGELMLKFKLFQWHKSIGITVLVLSLLRLAWRLGHRPPGFPATMPRWQRILARVSHGAFYVLMIGMPLSGWMMVTASPRHIPTFLFGLVRLPGFPILADWPHKEAAGPFLHGLHSWGGVSLWLLLGLHVGAALKHHFFDHDGVLRRMLPWV